MLEKLLALIFNFKYSVSFLFSLQSWGCELYVKSGVVLNYWTKTLNFCAYSKLKVNSDRTWWQIACEKKIVRGAK